MAVLESLAGVSPRATRDEGRRRGGHPLKFLKNGNAKVVAGGERVISNLWGNPQFLPSLAGSLMHYTAHCLGMAVKAPRPMMFKLVVTLRATDEDEPGSEAVIFSPLGPPWSCVRPQILSLSGRSQGSDLIFGVDTPSTQHTASVGAVLIENSNAEASNIQPIGSLPSVLVQFVCSTSPLARSAEFS